MRQVPEQFAPHVNNSGDVSSLRVSVSSIVRLLSTFFQSIGYRLNKSFPKDGSEPLEGLIELTDDGPKVLVGSGTPEGAETAVVGSVFHRTDGGAGTSFYVKESGTGNTGWVGK